MIIGLAEWNPIWEDKQKNMLYAQELVEKAARNRVDILLLPETTLTGFTMNVSKMGEESGDSKTIRFFQKLSEKYGIGIGFGYISKEENGMGENHFVIVNKGTIQADYSKIHPFTYAKENEFYQGGHDLKRFDMGDMTFGMYICYDLRFPSIFTAQAKKCHAMIVIANWPSKREEHWRTLLRARAIENQCYMIGVNRAGEGNGITYPNHSSLVIDPDGQELSIFPGEIRMVDINKETVMSYRRNFPVLEDLKLEDYTRFLAE